MNTFFGTIAKVLDPDLYTVEVDIPGENERLKAFPFRGEVDEPRVGDTVFLRELDPLYHSYYLYEKLKENDFIGIRARGKKIWIKEDFIQIGIIPPDTNNSKEADSFPQTIAGEWYDDNSGKDTTPSSTSWIQIDKEGNVEIEAEGNQKIHITGNSEVTVDGDHKLTVGGNCVIEVSGNADVKAGGNMNCEASGNMTVKAPNVKVEGSMVQITGGTLQVDGTAVPTGSGPFCGISSCLFTSAPHCSTTVSST